MPLEPNKEVFITCAVTGSGNTQERSSYVPRSPSEIATSAIEAAKAGAPSRPIAPTLLLVSTVYRVIY